MQKRTAQHLTLTIKRAQHLVDEFNRTTPIGAAVRFWRGPREGAGLIASVAHPAELLGGHTPVCWLDVSGGAIALSHIEPLIAHTSDA